MTTFTCTDEIKDCPTNNDCCISDNSTDPVGCQPRCDNWYIDEFRTSALYLSLSALILVIWLIGTLLVANELRKKKHPCGNHLR